MRNSDDFDAGRHDSDRFAGRSGDRTDPPLSRSSAQTIVTAADRSTDLQRSGKQRVEPTFGGSQAKPDPWLDLRATRDDDVRTGASDMAEPDRKPRQKGNAKAPSRKKKPARKQRRSLLGRLFYWSFVLGVWCVVIGGGTVAYYATQLPPIDQLAIPKRPPNIAIMGEDGTLLANRGDTGGANIALKELPPYLPKAFVAIEDRRFYSHFGIDPIGIFRALVRNVTGKSIAQGGSTLTQQLAKNVFLTQERTMSRKIQEAILAIWLEHKYTKDQILELYINRVYFGSGAFGVEAAAQKYFGKSARQVTVAEAAVLAGLMKAPTKLAPNRNPTGANARAAEVIQAMQQEGYITPAMAQVALAHPATVKRERGGGAFNYAADYVMDTLEDTVGEFDQDIVVTTTFNPGLQDAAQKAIDGELDAKGQKFDVSQGALVALDMNGGIKALVGGRNYSDSQFNRAISAKRQPGSSFKPFVYLTALERGLTPDTIREDKPLNIGGWRPENSSRDYRGSVTLTQALAFSINTVAVQLGLEVGPKAVIKTAHRLGITAELQPNASIALGTSEVTPLEMVGAYDAFANGGYSVQPHAIVKVATTAGKVLYQRRGSSFGRVIEPQYDAMMNTMLQETLLTGTARKAELPGWQAAGKTGTSQDYRDAWFIGYTSRIVAGVWLGNDDNSPTRKASGANLPVEIWSRFMRTAHQGKSPTGLPGGLWTASDAPVATINPPLNDTQQAAWNPQPTLRDTGRGSSRAGLPPVPDQPMTVNATEPPPDPTPRRRSRALVPPDAIPDTPPEGDDSSGPGLFQRLFGG